MPFHLVGDFDIILLGGGLTSDGHLKEKVTCCDNILGKPVHLNTYPLALPKALLQDENLAFLMFREVQKIRTAIYLDGSIEEYRQLRSDLDQLPFPTERVRAILDVAVSKLTATNMYAPREIISAIRALYLACGFLYSQLGPLKMKWLCFSHYAGFPESFMRIITLLSDIYDKSIKDSDVRLIINEAAGRPLIPEIEVSLLDSARLLEWGYATAAKFPLHYAIDKINLMDDDLCKLVRLARAMSQHIDQKLVAACPELYEGFVSTEQKLRAELGCRRGT